jgi:hypothetical protein
MEINQKIWERINRFQELTQAYTSGISLQSDLTSTPNYRMLAHWCFYTMKEELHFNICGAKTSFLRNADLRETSQLSSDVISPELAYATQHWANLLQFGPFDENLLAELDYFISTQFLYWLEVLSFLECVHIASPSLLRAAKWIQVSIQFKTFMVYN